MKNYLIKDLAKKSRKIKDLEFKRDTSKVLTEVLSLDNKIHQEKFFLNVEVVELCPSLN